MRTLQTSALALALLGCRDPNAGTPTDTFADPTDAPTRRGSGPSVVFDQDELFLPCAYLEAPHEGLGGYQDAASYRGQAVLTWAGEQGGLMVADLEASCDPQIVGIGASAGTARSRGLGFVHLRQGEGQAGDWLAAGHKTNAGTLGIQIWDLTDPAVPTVASAIELPDTQDAGAHAIFWQYPWLWVAAGSQGIYGIDATNPLAPEIVSHVGLDVGMVAGNLSALGSVLMVTSAAGALAVSLDISDPTDPRPIAGSAFLTSNAEGTVESTMAGVMVGPWALFSRYEGGGGVLVYDVSDPSKPSYLNELSLPLHSGGSVAYDEGILFLGSSNAVHAIEGREITDLNIDGTGEADGDLRAMFPLANLTIIPADNAPEGEGTVLMPWFQQPDTTGPDVLRIDPPDGATGVAPTARIGVAFNEPVDAATVFAGSVRIYAADRLPIEGWGSAQGTIATYTPFAPLVPGTTYTLEVHAEGVTDLDGNPTSTTITSTFTTAN